MYFVKYTFPNLLDNVKIASTSMSLMCEGEGPTSGPFHLLGKIGLLISTNFQLGNQLKTREGFIRKNIVAVSFFQNCAIHQYS